MKTDPQKNVLRHRWARRFVAVAAGLVSSAVMISAARHSDMVPLIASSETVRSATVPGVPGDWWTKALDTIERGEYHPSAGEGGLQSPNRAHDFRTYYRASEIEIVPRRAEGGATWRFSWQTVRWGRPGRMQPVEAGKAPPPFAAAPELVASRVIYRHPGLSEWYENSENGLEQGFTIDARPDGAGPLSIEGAIGGALRPELSSGNEVDFRDAGGAVVLHYGTLAVFDAEGDAVDSRLAVNGTEVAILIDDDEATYPLTVDPVLTTPLWSFESNQAGANLGVSVATAGDVNDDGYSDVVAGAGNYDNGQTNEGKVFLFHGSPAGPSPTPSWSAEGNQASAYFGGSVAPAGDVNGDGYGDVIIGAFTYDNGQVDEGRAFVYLGSAGGLGPSPAWTAEGNQAAAGFGVSVAPAGDVNGDDYADVIIGAFYYDNGQGDEGRAFVYRGSATGLQSSAAWTAEGNQASAYFGSCVATAGDVNADGFDDVIVAAPDYDNGQTDEGRVFVYRGSASGPVSSSTWTAESDQAGAECGRSAAAAGDVNGDGYADVIVGMPLTDTGAINGGRVNLYYGSATGLTSSIAWYSTSSQANAKLGWSVGTAGDVNGDGYSDIVMSAVDYDTGSGRAWLYEGSNIGPGPLSWDYESDQVNSHLGYSVATAGDVNGDGYSDLIVGAWAYDAGATDEGKTWVFAGTPKGLTNIPWWTMEPDQMGALFGLSVAYAGDVNGDGYSDVIIGAPGYDGGAADEGRAFIYHGSPAGLPFPPSWTAESNQAGATFGWCVASAHDVNGDGYDDVIIGAPEYNDHGAAFVYLGSPGGVSPSYSWHKIAANDSSRFGVSVGWAGDVNGDGYADVIVGDPNFTDDQVHEGRAIVYPGSVTGLSVFADWALRSNEAGSYFGYSVGTAGDVDGDGYSEVIVGEPGYSNGQANEGSASVYHGTPDGIVGRLWTYESNSPGASFGCSVASAGDVNGDGFSDVVVGAEGYAHPDPQEGGAWVFIGSASGLTLNTTLESNSPNAQMGHDVASAGDVNGDGESDVLVGCPGQTGSGGLPQAGRCHLLQSAPVHTLDLVWSYEANQSFARFGSSAATGGDVNGDGFSDVIIGAPGWGNGQPSEGRAYFFYGGGGNGLDRIARQAWVFDSDRPVTALGISDAEGGIRLKANGRTPAGRGDVRFEWQVARYDQSFDDVPIRQGAYFDTGTPGPGGSYVSFGRHPGDLDPGTLYHWRVRFGTDSPFFPHSRWLSLADNAASEGDIRTAFSGTTSVSGAGQDVAPANPAALMQPGYPNPFQTETRVNYTLPHEGRVHVTVLDVQGRRVVELTDGEVDAGGHVARWDGADATGAKLAAGIYYVRLDFEGRSESQKIVLTR